MQNDVLGRRNIICDDESRNIVLEYLYKEILARGQDNRKPHIVVFVYRDNGIRRHPVSALMQEAKDKGITFVYFDEYSEYLPKSCEYLIRMQDLLHGEQIDCSGSRKPQSFTASVLEDGVLARAMKKLAPVYCEEISLESTLTKNITFFELMNIYGPEDIDLAENWGSVLCLPLHGGTDRRQIKESDRLSGSEREDTTDPTDLWPEQPVPEKVSCFRRMSSP